VPLGVAGLALLLFTVFHPGARQARNGDTKSDDEAPLAGVGVDQ
jgi:hypothetical protein